MNRPASNAAEDDRPEGKSPLRVIAGFKFAEAALLTAAGLGALGLLQTDWQHSIVDWLDQLSLHEGRRLTSELASRSLDLLGTTTVGRLMLIAIGCFVYAIVHVVEGTGLWLRKRWAEYVTILITASFMPFEIVELVHGVSVPKLLTLVVNVGVVAYLVWHLLRRRGQRR